MFENENVRWVKWAGCWPIAKWAGRAEKEAVKRGTHDLWSGAAFACQRGSCGPCARKQEEEEPNTLPPRTLFSVCAHLLLLIFSALVIYKTELLETCWSFHPTHGRPSSLMETTPSRRPRNRWCSGNSRGICYYWSGRAAFLVLAESWELSWEKRKVALNRLLFAPLKCRGGGRVVVVERIYFPVWPKCWRVTFVSIRIKRERERAAPLLSPNGRATCATFDGNDAALPLWPPRILRPLPSVDSDFIKRTTCRFQHGRQLPSCPVSCLSTLKQDSSVLRSTNGHFTTSHDDGSTRRRQLPRCWNIYSLSFSSGNRSNIKGKAANIRFDSMYFVIHRFSTYCSNHEQILYKLGDEKRERESE